ncbi:MAG: SLC13 family permease [Desulfurispora sp.]|uniref:ArsB/NhaD family transporter n=1 Tax=Desulfurispora sp. TaxID=3014275 RepID=UPI004048EB99
MTATTQAFLATSIFLLVYAIIVSEKIHRTVIALVGAAVLVLIKILTPEQAIEAVDFNTIGLLIGMMMIVGITRQTGVFEYLAIKAAKRSGGHPLKIMAALALVTAVLSALLDNVTTVLLIVPVTFAIAEKLQVSPLSYLIVEIIASNVGGTATLIGDPPNIMIGSATHLGFMDFVINLTPVVIVVYALTIFFLKIIYRGQLVAVPERQAAIMELDENEEIKDHNLLRKCLLVMFLTIAGFALHQFIHMESSVIALSGASLLLLLSRQDPEHALHAVEWPVIFFFAGLFIIVGGLEHTGVIEKVARWSLDLTGGQLVPMSMLILWVSAIASAFVDNIPFVATMIPLIHNMGQLGAMADLDLLWWSLALGACLGGNGTVIGASANVVVIGMAEKRGLHITFLGFMKVAFPLMIMSIVISTGYLLLWYYMHGPLTLLGVALAGLALSGLLGPLERGREKGVGADGR